MNFGPISAVCPVCGKMFFTMWQEFWTWRRGETLYCSNNCLQVDMTRDLKMLNEARKRRKEANKMIQKKVTLAQKKRAVEIAINGGNPLEYLKGLGSKKPDGLWYTIKKDLKEVDPETYAKIPDYRGKTRKPAEEKPQITARVIDIAPKSTVAEIKKAEAPVYKPIMTEEERAEIRQEIAEQEKRAVEKANSKPLEPASLKSRVLKASWKYEDGHVFLKGPALNLDMICLKAEEWIALTYEIRTMLKQLGLVRE